MTRPAVPKVHSVLKKLHASPIRAVIAVSQGEVQRDEAAECTYLRRYHKGRMRSIVLSYIQVFRVASDAETACERQLVRLFLMVLP